MTKKMILLVEDDEGIRLLTRTLLEEDGHKVVEASDGKKALTAIGERKPDLVLLDLQMPHMGGWQVLKELRKKPSTAAIPVILFTAHGDDATQLKAWDEEPNVVDFLAKPFSEVALSTFVKRALDPLDVEAEKKRRQAIRDELQMRVEKFDPNLMNKKWKPDKKFG
jgi:CheY-like chemotaxis protein